MQTLWRKWQRRVPWQELSVALPALLLLGVMLYYYRDFVSDDAFISFRYAEHLATGRGLEWNPGYRVEGYSNFLWVVACAALRVLGMPVPEAARLLTWLSAGLCVFLSLLLARRATTRPSWTLLALTPLTLSLSFPFHYWTAMRLETTFFSMLLLLAVYLFVREEESVGGRRWGSAVAFLAVALTRPEGPVFIAVPGIYLISRARNLRLLRALLRERAIWLAVFFGGIVLYFAWKLSYFGHLLPNTYYAKVSGEDVLVKGYEYVQRFVNERPYHLVLLIALLLLRGASTRAGSLLLGVVVTLTVVVVLEGGDWMREWRLLIPVTPLLVAGLGIGVQRRAATLSAWQRGSLAAGLLLLAAGVQGTMGTPWSEWKDALEGKPRDLLINLEGEMTRVSEKVGRWLRAHAGPNDLIAVNHAGAVPFYSGLPTIDMVGLNDVHIARVQGPRHGKWDADYVMKRKPRFIVLNTRVQPSGGTYVPGYWGGETAIVNHPDFKRFYVPVKKFWAWNHSDASFRGRGAMATAYIMIFRRDESRYQPVGRCFDFESGTYGRWTVEGKAFGEAPATGPMGFQRVEGFEGRYLADSFPGSDAPAGTLRSRPFTLEGDRMELLVGGGQDPEKVGVRLLVGEEAVAEARGKNSGTLRRVVWKLGEHRGEEAVLEIYDRGPGPWGHILVDDICQYRTAQKKK